jgi:hypothetical protein
VGLDRSAAIQQAGAFALDSFLMSQDLRSASLLPGATDTEKLGFIDRELELLNLEDRASQIDTVIQGIEAPLVGDTMRVAARVQDLRSMLESARTNQSSPGAVLLELSNQGRQMIEQAAGLTALLQPTACGDLDGRCSDPRFRTVALATLLRRNALRGEESLVRDKLDQLVAMLGKDHPYPQHLAELWVPVAGLRAGKFNEPMKKLFKHLDEMSRSELRFFVNSEQDGYIVTGEGFKIQLLLRSGSSSTTPQLPQFGVSLEQPAESTVRPSQEERRSHWEVRDDR